MSETGGTLIEVAAARTKHFVAAGRTVNAERGWQWIVSGFALFKLDPLNWVAIGVSLIVFFVAVSRIFFLGDIVLTLLAPALLAGVMLACRAAEHGEKLTLAHLFAGFKAEQSGKLFGVGVLGIIGLAIAYIPAFLMVGYAGFKLMMQGDFTAAVTLGITYILAVLVVMALSIPIYMALWFASALVVFDAMDPLPAVKASFAACVRNTLPFLLYSVVLVILCILAFIPFGLGFLILAPVFLISIYAAYCDIFFTP